MSAPLTFEWDGESMRPATPFMARQADKQFVIGERYQMERHEERSHASHAHYFASIHDMWETLPEHLAERFPSSEALRHYALIRAGYCDSNTIVASSKAEALRFAGFIRPMDSFSIVTVKDCTVTRYTAHSQSYKAMGRKVFQESKDAVLNQIAILLGVDRRDAA